MEAQEDVGRTNEPACRCGLDKEDTIPGLMLCTLCDALVLSLVTARDLPPET